MYHVMISDNNVIIIRNGQIEEYKKAGYRLRCGSSSEKTASEMAKRLAEEILK